METTVLNQSALSCQHFLGDVANHERTFSRFRDSFGSAHASSRRFLGMVEPAEHAQKAKRLAVLPGRPHFGVRRGSAAFRRRLVDDWHEVIANAQRVRLKRVDRSHHRRGGHAFEPPCGTPSILIRHWDQSMLYSVLMYVVQPREIRFLIGNSGVPKVMPDLAPRSFVDSVDPASGSRVKYPNVCDKLLASAESPWE